jgi:hypothetical protein
VLEKDPSDEAMIRWNLKEYSPPNHILKCKEATSSTITSNTVPCNPSLLIGLDGEACTTCDGPEGTRLDCSGDFNTRVTEQIENIDVFIHKEIRDRIHHELMKIRSLSTTKEDGFYAVHLLI